MPHASPRRENVPCMCVNVPLFNPSEQNNPQNKLASVHHLKIVSCDVTRETIRHITKSHKKKERKHQWTDITNKCSLCMRMYSLLLPWHWLTWSFILNQSHTAFTITLPWILTSGPNTHLSAAWFEAGRYRHREYFNVKLFFSLGKVYSCPKMKG